MLGGERGRAGKNDLEFPTGVDHLLLNRHYPNNPSQSSVIPGNKGLKRAPNKGYEGGFHQLFLPARPRSPPGD
ncbi:hypothetical protein AGMMS49928_01990 [Spirochaetia bacterium]|nr:hypothetical protein AGMMS49928_01990 [Spirochaetia bacterium]